MYEIKTLVAVVVLTIGYTTVALSVKTYFQEQKNITVLKTPVLRNIVIGICLMTASLVYLWL